MKKGSYGFTCSKHHHAVALPHTALFDTNNFDPVIKVLREHLKQHPTKEGDSLQLLVSEMYWRYLNLLDNGNVETYFNTQIQPRLSEVFGDITMTIGASRYLKDGTLSLAWGTYIKQNGAYELAINGQPILCYDSHAIFDDALLTHIGLKELTSPHSLTISIHKLDVQPLSYEAYRTRYQFRLPSMKPEFTFTVKEAKERTSNDAINSRISGKVKPKYSEFAN